jgi:hypothetical protein
MLNTEIYQYSLVTGFTSHNTAARRTSQFEYFGPESDTFRSSSYYGLARDRPDAVQGGAPFPDYLYACGEYHDAGEEAHWTPFQMAAADYIRATYPTWEKDSRDKEGPGLVAFMLGVVSHYIADMNWHGLGKPSLSRNDSNHSHHTFDVTFIKKRRYLLARASSAQWVSPTSIAPTETYVGSRTAPQTRAESSPLEPLWTYLGTPR